MRYMSFRIVHVTRHLTKLDTKTNRSARTYSCSPSLTCLYLTKAVIMPLCLLSSSPLSLSLSLSLSPSFFLSFSLSLSLFLFLLLLSLSLSLSLLLLSLSLSLSLSLPLFLFFCLSLGKFFLSIVLQRAKFFFEHALSGKFPRSFSEPQSFILSLNLIIPDQLPHGKELHLAVNPISYSAQVWLS